MTCKRYGLPKILASVLALQVIQIAEPWARPCPDLPAELEGTLHGAPYRIRVPANWNGTLLMLAHGYGRPLEPFLPITPSYVDQNQEEYFLSRGYALAASAFSSAGWAVKEGLRDTLALTHFFGRRFGAPEHTILWGRSMGSVVAFKSAEKYPRAYDAFIPMCAVGGGTSRWFDALLLVGVAYHVTFGWPDSWGSLEDVRDDVDYFTEVLPLLEAQVVVPENKPSFEFIRLVSRLPFAGFYEPPTPAEWPVLFQYLYFLTQGRAELEMRAGGPVVQNLDHVYSLLPDDAVYLQSLGVDTETLLAEMNTLTVIEADQRARSYLRRYADYSGRIRRPVLVLHGTNDGIVPVYHETAYRETVEAAGKEDLLVQTFTPAVGHCDYNDQQLEAVVVAMEQWLETAEPPGPDAFPEDLGFLPDFEPGPFPLP